MTVAVVMTMLNAYLLILTRRRETKFPAAEKLMILGIVYGLIAIVLFGFLDLTRPAELALRAPFAVLPLILLAIFIRRDWLNRSTAARPLPIETIARMDRQRRRFED
jgi:hypothetical protein